MSQQDIEEVQVSVLIIDSKIDVVTNIFLSYAAGPGILLPRRSNVLLLGRLQENEFQNIKIE